MNSFKILLSASLLALCALPSLAAEPGQPGDDGSLILNTQINLQNVKQLRPAWSFSTGVLCFCFDKSSVTEAGVSPTVPIIAFTESNLTG